MSKRDEPQFLNAYTRADLEEREVVNAAQDDFDAGRISVDQFNAICVEALGLPKGWPREP